MDDRIAEIREALDWWEDHGLARFSQREIDPVVDAARAYADLLDSDALISGEQMSPNMDMATDVLAAVRYARPFFNEETDLGKALTIVFDAATRYAGSFQQVPGVLVASGPDYEAAAKWLQQRWESEAVQDGFPATPWDDLEPEDRDWWLTQAQGVVAAALADSDALIIRLPWPEWAIQNADVKTLERLWVASKLDI